MPESIRGKKILLHICCASCAVYTVQFFKKEGLKISAIFYNPNIHGENEYKSRLKDVEKLCAIEKMDLAVPEYNMEEYFNRLQKFINILDSKVQ